MTELDLLSSRVRRLENRFRWAKIIGMLGCVLLIGIAVMAQVRPRPGEVLPSGILRAEQVPERSPAVEQEVRAHQIILVDGKGKERASLVADNAGSVFLVMSDTNGKSRVNLSVSNDGPTLTFFDP